MNDAEVNAFRIVYQFYAKWREIVIETQDQWNKFAQDVGQMGRDLGIDHNPLGWHLMEAVLETINDLYKDGMKPMPAGYFGRDDLST